MFDAAALSLQYSFSSETIDLVESTLSLLASPNPSKSPRKNRQRKIAYRTGLRHFDNDVCCRIIAAPEGVLNENDRFSKIYTGNFIEGNKKSLAAVKFWTILLSNW